MNERPVTADELPITWALTTLGSVVDYGQTEKAEPEEFDDDDWILELEDIEKGTSRLLARVTGAQRRSKSTKNRFGTGEVLYGKLRPYLNKVLIADRPGYCTTEIIPLKPGGHLDARYLFYWLKHPAFLAYVAAKSHGMNMPRLGTAAGKAAPFVLAPPAEQKRIADQLASVLTRVLSCEHRLDNTTAFLKQFRRKVLSAATLGDLTPQFDRHTDQTTSTEPYPLIPVAQVIAEPLRNGKSVRDGDGLAVLRLTALTAGGLDLRENKSGDWSGVSNTARFLVQDGDFLISRGNGSKELVGRAGLVAGCRVPIAFPDTMIRLRPNSSRLLADYLKIIWNSESIRAQIESTAKTTAGIWKVSQGDLERIHIPLPSVEEQSEIVRRVESLFALADRLEAHCNIARDHVARLTPLTLAKAFRGELVPQDPNDEPAGAMLERIREHRTSQPIQKKSGRPSKEKPMKTSPPISLSEIVDRMSEDSFTFDQLRDKAPRNYETLKDELFTLLADPKSGLQQFFDANTQSMKFKRICQ